MQVQNQSTNGNEEINYNDFVPKHPKRNKMYKKFHDLLFEFANTNGYNDANIQKMALNIERGIFNYALKLYLNSHNRNKKLTHWCDSFNIYYTNRCIIIYSNLNEKSSIKNTQLIKRLFNNECNEFQLSQFTSKELFPERYNELTQLYGLDKVIIREEKEIPDGMIKCKKCRSYKTTYYEMQTRSADEPTTKFVTCHKCDAKFKVY